MDFKMLKPYLQFQFDSSALENVIQNGDKTAKSLKREVFDNEFGDKESDDTENFTI